MRILAFDTSFGKISAALFENQEKIQELKIDENGKQAEMLIPTIETLLNKQKIWYQNLDLIATINGPGSFTSVRIALSCAKALKIVTNLPIITFDALEVLAFGERKYNGKILAAIDAKSEEFFTAEFLMQNEKMLRLTESKIITKEEFEKIAAIYKENNNLICTDNNCDISKSVDSIALMAIEQFNNNSAKTDLNPLYLRGPNITKRAIAFPPLK